MAALALGVVGTAIGSSIGGSLLGVSLATIGGIIGSAAGGVIDNLIIASLTPAQRTSGPRLQEMTIMTSSEGAPLGRLYGVMRVSGNLIWATRFKETVSTTSTRVGGGRFTRGQKIETTTYTYSVSMAIAFGEGNERTQLGRVWMDGKEIDLSSSDFQFYSGTENQAPDATIQSIEGADNTPAFRGTTYLVFTDFDLSNYGNRIPQVTAEIISPVITDDPDDISNIAQSFCLIPGSGEFVYGTEVYTLQAATESVIDTFYPNSTYTNVLGDSIDTPDYARGATEAVHMNMHTNRNETDFVRSMTQLEVFQPNLDAIILVVGWFGSDLRIGECEIRPKVEFNDRGGVVTPRDWNVQGFNREGTGILEVPQDADGNPYYGGTPSDDVIVEAIRWLKERGHRVVFYPFIFMDMPENNTLPTPYSDNASTLGQPAFPWRGRITCSPAAGFAGTVDKTAAAAAQVDTFFTRTWGVNNMIEHYAQLCTDAGGVDGFVIGTEMPGATTIRSDASTYPAIAHFKTLAATVKGIVGSSCDVGYAADWSEYHSHRPSDGTNDVFFNMDPLWEDSNIDFIGIDNYLPLSDWRDGSTHLDYDIDSDVVSPYNLDYLRSNVEGGELYDWFYASRADRDNQVRTPITDGSYGKPWVFRQKDIRNWWSNSHYDRPGGIESTSSTSYTPSSKPIWFTEFGCPSVDKGTNQPNVFYDPKSSESFFPHYSSGRIDEFIPRVYAEATLTYWRDNAPAGMLELKNMFIWCWDARPYPDYPFRSDVWSDGALWDYGHWMTGRLAYTPLPKLVEKICEEVGLTNYDTSKLKGAQALVQGYYVDNVMAARDMIGSLMTGLQFDAFESQGMLRFVLKSSTALVPLQLDDLVSTTGNPTGLQITRTQETELPSSIQLNFLDPSNDYEVSSLDAKRHSVNTQETVQISLPIVLNSNYARALGDSIIHQAWAARENGSLTLPPSFYKIDPGDGITLPLGNRVAQMRIQGADTGGAREMSFQGFDLSMYQLPVYPSRPRAALANLIAGFPELFVLDIPLFSGEEPNPWSPRLAAWARPWPGAVAVYENIADENETVDYSLIQTLQLQDTVGFLDTPLEPMPTGILLQNHEIRVQLFSGGVLFDATETQMLNGSNFCALQNDQGSWEIFQYTTATLQGSSGYYVLTGLIRGQLGTEWVMNEATFSKGATFVFLTNQFSISENAPYLPLGPGDRGNEVKLRFGSAYDSVDDGTAYLNRNATSNAVAQMPYAPVHLNARWNLSVNDNISLSWVRRSRFGADDWELSTVPLHEENEEYDIQILDGLTVVREVTGLTSPAYTYTEAMQASDFGSSQTTSIKFRVYQISANVGRGTPAEETVAR